VDESLWRFHHRTTPNSGLDWAYQLLLRLPTGAQLLQADPPPTETHRHGESVTLLWRAMLSRMESPDDGTFPIQFECRVEYASTPGAER
jgi:hypothetical protein